MANPPSSQPPKKRVVFSTAETPQGVPAVSPVEGDSTSPADFLPDPPRDRKAAPPVRPSRFFGLPATATSASAMPLIPATKSKPLGLPGIKLQIDPADLRPRSTSLLEYLRREIRQGGYGAAVSLGLHLLAMVVGALIIFHTPRLDDLPALIARFEKEGPQDKNATGSKGSRYKPVEIPSIKIDPTTGPANPNTRPVETTPKPEADTASDAPPSTANVKKPGDVQVSGALSGRANGEGRDVLLKSFGGTKESESAVGLGLTWLGKQQRSDGRWELHKGDPANGYPDPGAQNLRTDTGATALALLCYLGSGHTHLQGQHKEKVRQGINWLKNRQKPNGDFHDFDEEGRQTAFYAHGQATIAMCEALAMSGDGTLREPVRKAIKFIIDSQHPDHGGWKYRPHSEGDLSVLGWQLMALESARMAGMDVPSDTLDRASHFLDLVSVQRGARYKYDRNPNPPFSPAMTAEGLLCRQYLGWPRDHPAMRDGVKYLTQEQNLPSWTNGRRNVYYWYYATQVLHNYQGPEWEKWNKVLVKEILSNQDRLGKTMGSWSPVKFSGDPFEYADKGGRHYMTCMCILILEVYYRHLPIYKDIPVGTPKSED